MPRPPGRRNADFLEKREALARRLRVAWLERGPGTSLQDLAAAAGASVTNLRHYFGDRDGVFAAVAEEMHRAGQRFMDDAAVPRSEDPREALQHFVEAVRIGWRDFGVDRVHAVSLAEGLVQRSRGRAYVTHVLEPTLACCESLLAALCRRGALPALDTREAALALLAPLLLALLHQDALAGDACRPLDVPAFAQRHVDAWLRGHAAPARAKPSVSRPARAARSRR